jgi:hypothetical protein
MKDINQLACAMLYRCDDEEKKIRYIKMGFYDPDEFELDEDIQNDYKDLYLVNTERFLEYTDGSPEENATIRERFPNLISVLEGNAYTVPNVKAILDMSSATNLMRNSFNKKDDTGWKDVLVISHNSWNQQDLTFGYELEVISFHFAINYTNKLRQYICTFKDLTFKLAKIDIPKIGTRIFNVPLRFDQFSTFREASKLLLSLTYWPKEIALFSAVTKYFNEKPFISTIVYHPRYHTMKDVFLRLFSHKKKGFTSSLYDICKVIDIMEKHDSETLSEEEFTGGKYIGGIDKATVKAYLGLRTFVRAKKIEKFREIVDGEIDTTKKFLAKLNRIKVECEAMYKIDSESSLSDLSKKLIEDLYESVVADPTSYTGLKIDTSKGASRDLVITKTLTDLCLTTPMENELLAEEDTNNGTADETATDSPNSNDD